MSKPTDTITIRVPGDLKTHLDAICKREKINMNLLINQILEKSVYWDTHLSKMGWVTFQPSVVNQLMNCISRKEMEEIASKISGDIVNSIKFLYGDNSFESLIKFFESWLQSTNSPYRHDESTNHHKFIVDHKLGKNWSEFAVLSSTAIVEKLGFKIGLSEINENQYSYVIEKPSTH